MGYRTIDGSLTW